MHSIDKPSKTAKKTAKSPHKNALEGTLAAETGEDIDRREERSAETGGDGGDGGDSGDGNDHGPLPSYPIPLGPQFAVRIGDGAMLMAVQGHADDRDLTGREAWTCFVLTPQEAKLVRERMGHAEHDAAARIGSRLPRKP